MKVGFSRFPDIYNRDSGYKRFSDESNSNRSESGSISDKQRRVSLPKLSINDHVTPNNTPVSSLTSLDSKLNLISDGLTSFYPTFSQSSLPHVRPFVSSFSPTSTESGGLSPLSSDSGWEGIGPISPSPPRAFPVRNVPISLSTRGVFESPSDKVSDYSRTKALLEALTRSNYEAAENILNSGVNPLYLSELSKGMTTKKDGRFLALATQVSVTQLSLNYYNNLEHSVLKPVIYSDYGAYHPSNLFMEKAVKKIVQDYHFLQSQSQSDSSLKPMLSSKKNAIKNLQSALKEFKRDAQRQVVYTKVLEAFIKLTITKVKQREAFLN